MSVETRTIRGRTYVTRTVREGKKVKKQHLGPITNPVNKLLLDQDRLDQANAKHQRSAIAHEKEQLEAFEAVISLLDLFVAKHRLLQNAIKNEPRPGVPMKSETPANVDIHEKLESLPGAHAVSRLRRLANEGNEEAQAELTEFVCSSYEVADAIFNPVRTARSLLKEAMSGGEFLLGLSIDEWIDHKIDLINLQNVDDPIARCMREYFVVADLSAMHAAVAAARPNLTKADRKHFQGLADRALKRLHGVAKLMQQLVAGSESE